jgi:hypothetical protein
MNEGDTMKMFEITESGFDTEADCYFALATMYDGGTCRVRVNAFEPQNRRIDHQSGLPQEVILEICHKITKEVFRLHINK